MAKTFAVGLFAALLCASAVRAQTLSAQSGPNQSVSNQSISNQPSLNQASPNLSPAADFDDAGPEAGGHELQVWVGSARGVPAAYSESNETVMSLGARYGWVITDPVGRGPLRGRFEYAVDLVPAYVINQPGGRAYGWGFNAFALKWNFQQHRRVSPYFEMTGGALFTNRNVPQHVNDVNFVTSAGIGAQFLRGKHNLSVDIRFMHISDAGLTNLNPGIDTIQFRLGFGLFTHPK